MANLFFPQLSTGAVVQYPLKKTRITRTIANLLPDGSVVSLPDPSAMKLLWEMAYTDLSPADAQALRVFFRSCCGPYHAFTFLDPADNLLSYSADLTNSSWQKAPNIQITAGIDDPTGGTGAWVLTNSGGASQTILQTLTVPANYRYCLSLYATSATTATLVLNRAVATGAASTPCTVGTHWTRLVSGGALDDAGTQLSVGLTLAAGQQITVFGPQLEAQVQPSRYRATSGRGGVYSSAHFVSDMLPLGSDAPDLFSTSFSIQTNI
jgi:hypothetical protein